MVWDQLSVLEEGIGALEPALESARKLVALLPGEPRSHERVGLLLLATGAAKEAAESLQRAQAMGLSGPRLAAKEGEAWLLAGAPSRALERLVEGSRGARDGEVRAGDVALLMARSWAANREHAKALGLAKVAARLLPAPLPALVVAGQAHVRLGQNERAREMFGAARVKDYRSVSALAGLALTAANLVDWADWNVVVFGLAAVLDKGLDTVLRAEEVSQAIGDDLLPRLPFPLPLVSRIARARAVAAAQSMRAAGEAPILTAADLALRADPAHGPRRPRVGVLACGPGAAAAFAGLNRSAVELFWFDPCADPLASADRRLAFDGVVAVPLKDEWDSTRMTGSNFVARAVKARGVDVLVAVAEGAEDLPAGVSLLGVALRRPAPVQVLLSSSASTAAYAGAFDYVLVDSMASRGSPAGQPGPERSLVVRGLVTWMAMPLARSLQESLRAAAAASSPLSPISGTGEAAALLSSSAVLSAVLEGTSGSQRIIIGHPAQMTGTSAPSQIVLGRGAPATPPPPTSPTLPTATIVPADPAMAAAESIFLWDAPHNTLEPFTADALSSILRLTADSVLVLRSPVEDPHPRDATIVARIRREFVHRGVDPERLIFDPNPWNRCLSLGVMSKVVMLDPPRLSDPAVMLRAILAGVPVVTAPGLGPASRRGAALIASACPGLVARNLAGYVQTAVNLASDVDQWRTAARCIKTAERHLWANGNDAGNRLSRVFVSLWDHFQAANKKPMHFF
jgi:tetratricopeptide (TPR) repeat protein